MPEEILYQRLAFGGRRGQDGVPIPSWLAGIGSGTCRGCHFDVGQVAEEGSVDGAGMGCAPLLPVDGYHGRLGGPAFQQLFQAGQALVGRERPHALGCEPASHFALGTGHHTDFVPESPVDAQRGLAQRLAMMGQRVEERVGCGVTSQQGGSQQGGAGGKVDEEIESSGGEQIVQGPAAVDFRPQGGPQLRVGQFQQCLRVGDPGGVDHTPHRWQAFGLPLFQEGGEAVVVGHIDGRPADLGSRRFQLADGLNLRGPLRVLCREFVPLAAGWQASAAKEDEGPRALAGHPSGDPQAQIAQAAADQVAGIAAPPQFLLRPTGGGSGHQPSCIALIIAVGNLVLIIAALHFPQHA